jgi:cell division protein FtsW (lipid II flippase)
MEHMETIMDKLMAWAKRDATIIIVCILALAGCLYTLMTTASYQKAINQNWMDQWEKSGCQAKPYQPNISFKYWGEYNGT